MKRREFVKSAALPLIIASGVQASGPGRIDESPGFWSEAVVLVGQVDSVGDRDNGYQILYFRVHAAVSGLYDCTAQPVVAVGFLGNGWGFGGNFKPGDHLMIVLSLLRLRNADSLHRDGLPNVEALAPYATIEFSPPPERGPIISIKDFNDPQIAKFAESIRKVRLTRAASWIEK